MISREEVLKLAELSRLKVGEEEVAALQKDISSILEYVGQVGAVSAAQGDAKKPLLRNVLREDVLREGADVLASKEEALRSAFPRREGNFNSVRKIIQKDE
jgi:aspartyl-tRNA(Asn)/glutamyl-tRNA(Gln) amidotransferase subunit C